MAGAVQNMPTVIFVSAVDLARTRGTGDGDEVSMLRCRDFSELESDYFIAEVRRPQMSGLPEGGKKAPMRSSPERRAP
jgi:hypothetical protein